MQETVSLASPANSVCLLSTLVFGRGQTEGREVEFEPRFVSRKTRQIESYTSWEQVSGYFDGDGTVVLSIAMFTVIPSLDWADSYHPQLESVRRFLVRNGHVPMEIFASQTPKPVCHLRLHEKGGLLKAMTNMLPHLCKKRDQVSVSIDYMKNRITGQEVIEAFNRATKRGTRSGFVRKVVMPYTHEEGVDRARVVAHSNHASKMLTGGVLEEILARRSKGEHLREISFSYGTSRSSVRRAILARTTRSKM